MLGTTNRSELATGFYVKWGDDSRDIEPLLHLYKTQVFQLARELKVPERILQKAPSPDLAPGITDEFALRIRYADLDRILQKIEKGEDLSEEKGVQVQRVKALLQWAPNRALKNLHL